MKGRNKLTVQRIDTSLCSFTDDECYTLIWVHSGVEWVKIDFEEFPKSNGSIYFVNPGRKVTLDCTDHASGWIIRFGREIFNTHIRSKLHIKKADMLSSFGNVPKMILSPKIGERIHALAEMIDELTGSGIPNSDTASASLLNTLLIYCDSKCNIRIDQASNSNEVQIVMRFKELVARHYKKYHKVSEYAEMMNISSRYLNQVVKNVLDMTAKQIIHDQLIIQARRELKFSNRSIKEIAYRLGFSEPFHFSNYFKNIMGNSPSEYRMQ
jgi:AraC family transcriptional regulator, transcriptional activator of pobA